MAGSNQYTVGTSPTLLAAAPVTSYPGPVGWFVVTNGSDAAIILAGGTQATTFAGATVPANGVQAGFLFSGDHVYAATLSGTSVVGVLQTGESTG